MFTGELEFIGRDEEWRIFAVFGGLGFDKAIGAVSVERSYIKPSLWAYSNGNLLYAVSQ